MRKVKWTSPDGYIHCAQVRDNDPDEFASKGIPCEPPDINSIDWEAVKRDTHNLLVEREVGMAAANLRSDLLRSVAQAVLYKRLVTLYQPTPSKEAPNG